MLKVHGIQSIIETTLLNANAIDPLPATQWASPRGIWVAQSHGDRLIPMIPDESDQFDLIWISENPGQWDKPHPPSFFPNNALDWDAWNRHYGEHMHIPHWRNISKAIPRVGRKTNMKIFFSNTYLFEWPYKKKYPKHLIAKWFNENQSNLFNFLNSSQHIHSDTQICLCGEYAQAAWSLYVQLNPQLTNIKYFLLGHPAYGHLAKSLNKYGL